MHDDYPGQEKLLLIAVRVGFALLVGVVVGAVFVERIADPIALLMAGVAAYGLYALRGF